MNKSEIGRKSRAKGKEFEREIYKDLRNFNWRVTRWTNLVKDNKIVPAKPKFISGRILGYQSGFPDFVSWRNKLLIEPITGNLWEIFGIECKLDGKLDKKEMEMVEFYLKNRIFDKFFIATKEEKKITYKEVKM